MIVRKNISASLLFVLALGVVSIHSHGADRTWNGGGADGNWGTGGNWGGTAPVNNDNLIFTGASQQNNTNNISNLTVGWMQFANGGFTLNGNTLTSAGSTTAFFTNLAGINTIACPLITTAPGGRYYFIAPGTELRLTGPVTNTAASGTAVGWLNLTNGGTVRIMNSAKSTRGMDLFQGTVIVDGNSALVDANNDGFRFKPPTGSTVAVQITNNGTIRIGGGGNFRMGHNGTGIGAIAGTGSQSRADISSGTLELYGANVSVLVGDLVAGATAVFNQNGGLVWGSAGSGNTVTIGNSANADGTYNLNGGTLWIAQVRQGNAGATNAVFNFNGGTLKPTGSLTTFMQGLLTANVQNGGAIIDTTNFNITIAQNLQAAGSGGLTKLGSGTLTLSGNNTYSGTTIVSNGTLLISGQLNGSGAVNVAGGVLGGSGVITASVTVQANAALAPGEAVGILTLQNNLTLKGDLMLDVDKSLAATNDYVQGSGALTNAGNGSVFISNLGPAFAAGDSFKFFSKPLSNGQALVISPATPGIGLLWTNKLAVDGTVGVLPAPSVSGGDLVSLALSVGTLTPSFTSNTYNYTVQLPYTNNTIALTPVSATNTTSIRIITATTTNLIASGATSSLIALHPGTNLVVVSATAPDNSLTKDYSLVITRKQPNVIVIFADDQGFSDWGCYGSEIPTPNIDRLAAGGLRFRQFYNTARCSTTRCALLTGLYTHQVAVDPSQALPNLRNDNNVTIAELLKANGYRTYMSGKWHLGGGALAPESRGFDQVWRYANATSHSEDTWNTNLYTFISSNGEVTNRIYASGEFYQSDALGDYALDFVNNSSVTHSNDKPFFLFMPFGSAHFPIQAPQSWVNSNAPVYAAGWDVIRDARYSNILAQGVLDARHVLSPNEGTAPWNSIGAEAIPAWDTMAADRQADLARRMAIYAAMVQKLDNNVGRVVERLRALGQLNSTLIFVMSDNGGNHEGAVFGQTGGTPNATPLTGTALNNMGLSGQPVIYLGGGWAHVNDTPFRLFKHFNQEGGIRTPLIVHWPQGLTRTNQWDNQPGHLIDIMASIVDATGVSYPTQFNSHLVLPLEGMSLKPLFTSTNLTPRTFGFEHEGNRAWRSGNWKLVTKNFTSLSGSPVANTLELYDLNTDPTELTNLANAYPAILGQMVTNWNAWATRVGVPSGRLISPVALFPAVSPAPTANDLFVDTFNRADNSDIDASASGMWGSRVPPLSANATYYEGFEGSGSTANLAVAGNALYKNPGGMIESGLMHNFIGADITNAGGFSVEWTVQEINSDGSDNANRFSGVAVGLSDTEAAAGGDINQTTGTLFRGKIGNANLGVADFFVELDYNGNIKVWSDGILLDTVPVGANFGTVTASFATTGFKTTDTVTVSVFFNGQQVDINTANPNSLTRTFQWDHNDSNYIGLSARASNFVQMDNLAIRKLPLSSGLPISYAMQYGLSDTDAAPSADPDADGVNNLAEWAFGGDPAAPDPSIAKLQKALLTQQFDFQFEHQRLTNAANYGLRYRYFVSPDLQAWSETTPTQVGVASNEDKPGYEMVTMKLLAASIAGQSKLFLRVRAEMTN
ncbi:MAG: sulfatase-like hydrolase/transferase [Verrucomicrobiota bacterium]